MTKQTSVNKPSNQYEEIDRQIATTLRMLAADQVQKANSGHPGLPLGAADLVTVLWTRFLKHNPADPTWPNRDRFILSAGHGSALLYSLLHLWGYPLSLDDLKNFRQWGSHTAGHPEYNVSLGIEITTGPLGQGFSTAVGMALAERYLAAHFNREGYPVMEHYTYVLASEGDLMEGISHEAASIAGHLKLGRLIVLYDDNGVSIDGPTRITYSDDVAGRFAAYGWNVLTADGHDFSSIHAALAAAQSEAERPSIIICRTHIGFGSPRQDMAKVHGEPLGEEDLRRTKEHFGWPVDKPFYIPDAVTAHMDGYLKSCAKNQADWEKMFAAYRQAYPELSKDWDAWVNGELPPTWDADMPAFAPDKPLATRAASGKVLDAVSPHLFTLIGGSADLTPSNNTRPQAVTDIQPGEYSGKYIRFGVREHGMGALLNGLALHGLRSYGGTFLVFSDYMRPAIRLAALMKLPVIYVFTHDSIGLGEDGPTHQPVEHITALRAIPNLIVIRPADSNETAQAWRVALKRKDGPTALILTRQAVPLITPANNPLEKGAYILADTPDSSKPKVILIATGSEVSLAMSAREQLNSQGVFTRVVSIPSWELFDDQTEEYRQSVLPPDVKARLAVEAGVTLAWSKLVGLQGCALGVDRFGASAPYKTLYTKYGLTVEAIVKAALDLS